MLDNISRIADSLRQIGRTEAQTLFNVEDSKSEITHGGQNIERY